MMSHSDSFQNLHILRGPDSRRFTGYKEVKWCFECRSYEVYYEVELFDSKPSYYEPLWVWRCSICNQDASDFPMSEGW